MEEEVTPAEAIAQAILDHPHLGDTIAHLVSSFEENHPQPEEEQEQKQ
jgi:hypothetical protein